MGTRLGVMGGTFDPIHVGHLVTAEEALHQFALDEVVFVPTGRPWMKEHDVVASATPRSAWTGSRTSGCRSHLFVKLETQPARFGLASERSDQYVGSCRPVSVHGHENQRDLPVIVVRDEVLSQPVDRI